MRIASLLKTGKPFVSLEFFPPKDRTKWPGFFNAVEKTLIVNPLFVSVTYGAMGSTRANTLEIVSRLKKEFGLETMAHLTCVGASGQDVGSYLGDLVRAGVDNVLALRGDLPQGEITFAPSAHDFTCAADLVSYIRARFPGLGIGVAAYPEGHPEAPSIEKDLIFLKRKLDRGADFAITQLFFDNGLYWNFVQRARGIGIDKPIIPGILPIVNLSNVARIISLCGATIPGPYLKKLHDAQRGEGGEAVRMIGVEYARKQAQELLDRGAPGVHLYTLNKAEACVSLVRGLDLETRRERQA
ncbi:MAG: methylenetetrahydrofolate reductase [Candidatus Aureabacteria bacterium]|nr:methylenetetrahydrofolate reductase [Candidatus Auribacterota bacterium]